MTQQSEYNLAALIDQLDHAFQPIVNIHTGICYGYEALLRNVEQIGFENIDRFFDHLSNTGRLLEVENRLQGKAIRKFASMTVCRKAKLFYNIDSRLLYMPVDLADSTYDALRNVGLSWDHFCYEISEKRDLSDIDLLKENQSLFRSGKVKIAIDDCGTGFSGFQSMYNTEPNLIKIDRFFICNISTDNKKRLFLSTIVNLAHLLGALVVAEGVETEKEYYCCRDIGCDLVQGYLVQKPVLDVSELSISYDHIQLLGSQDRRTKEENDRKLILSELEVLQPAVNTDRVTDVFEMFRTQKRSLLPIVNEGGEPIGMVREKVFKEYAYSRYGRELLEKVSRNQPIDDFIAYFPIAEVHTPIEKVLEIYTLNANMEGIIITDNMKYIGFLSARSLLKVLNDKNLAIARDLNPLTKLPGNTLIHEYVSNTVRDLQSNYSLVYFDFNNFKAYNDRYGFRQGDRALHLFSQILVRKTSRVEAFCGHVGGDDFFLGVKNARKSDVHQLVDNIVSTFREDVESFYDQETLQQGYITGKDRDGVLRQFPLMTISSAIISLPGDRSRIYSLENISSIIAVIKKRSKCCPTGVCSCDLAEIESQPISEIDFVEGHLRHQQPAVSEPGINI